MPSHISETTAMILVTLTAAILTHTLLHTLAYMGKKKWIGEKTAICLLLVGIFINFFLIICLGTALVPITEISIPPYESIDTSLEQDLTAELLKNEIEEVASNDTFKDDFFTEDIAK